ncbi:hypothetical protein [Methylobacterium sp. WL120]|uniref:hypothetical protein n=1 Tax=Methylobacterium sp. WL120 TaxID=2603887 RepID=UPI0011C7607F|nr:hypothetical protein [Methylobacterium sp. WL120]TXM59234.1 hypothetical protein FV229_25035 [Methylobacterium sp. WL120]
MQSKLAKTIIGAALAVALAVAVSYGLISQQTADKVQTQADQTLQTGAGVPPATPGQPAPAPAPQPSGQQPSQLGSPLQNPTPTQRQ